MPQAPKKRILVVDDDPAMRTVIAEFLRTAHEVREAGDGQEGLDMLRQLIFDLVVLDISMPRMHGFEFIHKIRKDPKLKGIKILVSSAKSYASDIATAKEAGADEYLVKPFDRKVLLETVEKLLAS